MGEGPEDFGDARFAGLSRKEDVFDILRLWRREFDFGSAFDGFLEGVGHPAREGSSLLVRSYGYVIVTGVVA